MKKIITLILGITLFYSCSTSSDGNGNSNTAVVPVAPSNLTGTVASSTQINLSWTDNSTNETGFKIERKTGTENYAVVGTTTADITTFNNSGLSPNTAYTYRVYSNNAVGNSLTYSNELPLTTINTIIIPTLITTAASSISTTTAISGGTISSDGGASITARGIVWSTSSSPTTILPTKTSDGTSIGSFTSAISGLTSNTTYYIRAYATNGVGTAYGNEYSFTTTASILPTITTTALSSITTTTAVSGGSISSDGGASITAKGVCWDTNSNPTINLSTKTNDGIGTGSFTSFISSLLANTTYYARTYATNSAGTNYGNEISFTTLPNPLAIGDSYQGGIIFYIFSADWPGANLYVPGEVHGLIASLSDLPGNYVWGCDGFLIASAGGTATISQVGWGAHNTQRIVELCGTGTAASACNGLDLNGYNDWYLPSAGDLEALNGNITGNNAISGEYWSSTERNKNEARAYSTTTGTLVFNNSKSAMKSVRPVRQF